MPTNQFINNSPRLTTNHFPIIFIGYNLCDYTKYNIQSGTGPLSDFFPLLAPTGNKQLANHEKWIKLKKK